ncbi:DUF2867 domain-containing protein [Actinomadura luteofluorescens]|uniref:DUF2867 domain-containing protein n=1 Tax=Actinomadura luteofluorescens TaxID=46163 RepID=UPI00363031B8
MTAGMVHYRLPSRGDSYGAVYLNARRTRGASRPPRRCLAMKLPASAHTGRPWRIHEIASGFRLEDVWALPVSGGPDDLPKLLEQMTSSENHLPGVAGVLFAIRWRLGRLLGWDKEDSGLDGRVRSLRERLPDDLRGRPAGPAPVRCRSGRST